MPTSPRFASHVPCQFIGTLRKDEKFRDGGGICVWADFTKFGKVTNNDLNDVLECVKSTLSRLPEKSMAFVICPHLISEKVQVQNNLRGEIRTAVWPNSPTHGFQKVRDISHKLHHERKNVD